MQTDELTPSEQPSLSPTQARVALALAAGLTITGAAEESGIHRVTVYRWLKHDPAFAEAVKHNRTEFILSRRDDLHHLSNRAMETLLAILDNPRSSPAVLTKVSMFILQRSQKAGAGWCLPERLPEPDRPTLTDSAVLETDCDRLACLDGLQPEKIEDAAECNTMQPETNFEGAGDEVRPDGDDGDDGDDGNEGDEPDEPETCEYPYSDGILPSCPIPAAVLQRRNYREHVLTAIDDYKAVRR
jgi:hypothetical protein